MISSKYASTPEHKENDTLKKLAAALYSETTVELSPSNLAEGLDIDPPASTTSAWSALLPLIN